MNTSQFPLSVAKFGGTSVADFEAMSRCADIVLADERVRLVVVSASSGVTNLLVELATGVTDPAERTLRIARINAIQHGILARLSQPQAVEAPLAALLAQVERLSAEQAETPTPGQSDALLSLGERCASLLFAQVLVERGTRALSFDASRVLRTDSHYGRATPRTDAIARLCQAELAPLLVDTRVVTQGFIGADAAGQITTLGRGGSDFSAALLAEGLGADGLAIWTDVDGIYSCDPRLVPSARPIPEMAFDEAAEMATFGAKVLHPATILPAVRAGCDVFVGSSRAPQLGGTWIRRQAAQAPVFRALSLRRNQTLLTVHSLNMLHAQGFLAELFAILARHRLSVDLITTSEVSVALTLDNAGSTSQGDELLTPALLAELETMCRVEVERDLALVAVIGNRIASTAGIANTVFQTLSGHNVRMICQGASPHNLCFLVAGDEASDAVRALHSSLLTG